MKVQKRIIVFIFSISFCEANGQNNIQVPTSPGIHEPQNKLNSLIDADFIKCKEIYPDLVKADVALDRKEYSLTNLPPEIKIKTVKIHYPHIAKDRGIQGTVYSRFIVSKNGEMKDIKVIQGIGGGCDEEILRALNEMAKVSFAKDSLLKYHIVENKFTLK